MIDGVTEVLKEAGAVLEDGALALAATVGPMAADSEESAPEWGRLPGNTCVREWAEDLRRAREAGPDARDAWKLAGRAVVLLSDDESLCSGILRRVAADAGLQFLYVAAADVADFAARENPHEDAPSLVYLQPGRWQKGKRNQDMDDIVEGKQKAQSAIADAIAAFDPAHPVVLVTSADEIRELAIGLRRPGVFDRFFHVQAPKLAALGEDIIDRIGRGQCAASITNYPGKVGVLFTREYSEDRRRELALLRLRRLLARKQRPLEFMDLVHVALQGFAESDGLPAESENIRRQTAVHEAGHAVVAVIGSNGRNVPECSSIIPSVHFSGVVVDSMQYVLDAGDQITYADMRQKVRIGLAGRAAEELVFGAEHVSSGATEDLKRATLQAGRAFSFWGFAPSMEREGQSGSNLAIAGIDDDPFTPSESAHVEELVREFLATEYQAVKEMLTSHRALLDVVTERLLRDALLDQEALAELVREHGPAGLQVDGPVGSTQARCVSADAAAA